MADHRDRLALRQFMVYAYSERWVDLPAMHSLSTVLALLIGIAGWHYLFYSQAAERLAAVEARRLNRVRVGLRRVGGAVLLLLAPVFFAGLNTVDPGENPEAFVAIWVIVALLLAVNMLLALADVGLTWMLRRQRLAAASVGSDA